jgi:hypothetical protein
VSEEAVIRALLVAANSAASSRIYPLRMPDQPTYPLITYQKVSGVDQRTRASGPSIVGATTAYSQEATAVRQRWQLNLNGTSYEQVRTLETQIRPYIDGFTGPVVAAGGTATVLRAALGEGRDGFEPGTELYQRQADLIIWMAR